MYQHKSVSIGPKASWHSARLVEKKKHIFANGIFFWDYSKLCKHTLCLCLAESSLSSGLCLIKRLVYLVSECVHVDVLNVLNVMRVMHTRRYYHHIRGDNRKLATGRDLRCKAYRAINALLSDQY